MANVTISIQSLLNAAVFDSFTVDNAITVATLKTTIQTNKGFNVTWFDLFYNGILLDTTQTIVSYGITTGTVLMTGNKIANLSTKQAKQAAKLALAGLKRVADGKARVTLDITQLPTQYSGDGITDNPNVGGLTQGRPWV